MWRVRRSCVRQSGVRIPQHVDSGWRVDREVEAVTAGGFRGNSHIPLERDTRDDRGRDDDDEASRYRDDLEDEIGRFADDLADLFGDL